MTSETIVTYDIQQIYTFIVEQQRIDDFICDAFMGISYWCSEATVFRNGAYLPTDEWPEGMNYTSEALTRGCEIRLYSWEDEKYVMLTLERLLEGIKDAATHRGRTIAAFLDDYDSYDGDLAVQYAVFNTIIFG